MQMTNVFMFGQTLVRLSNDSVLDEDEIFRFIPSYGERGGETQSLCVCAHARACAHACVCVCV
jgi:hypothetical protein